MLSVLKDQDRTDQVTGRHRWDIGKVEDVEDDESGERDEGEDGGEWPCKVYKLLTTPENKKQAWYTDSNTDKLCPRQLYTTHKYSDTSHKIPLYHRRH